MVSGRVIFGLGLVVSIINMFFWILILGSMSKQYTSNKMNNRIKTSLFVFGIAALLSNLMPIWFDIYQIKRNTHPSNIGIAYTTSQYLFRTITAFMFYIIYKEK